MCYRTLSKDVIDDKQFMGNTLKNFLIKLSFKEFYAISYCSSHRFIPYMVIYRPVLTYVLGLRGSTRSKKTLPKKKENFSKKRKPYTNIRLPNRLYMDYG